MSLGPQPLHLAFLGTVVSGAPSSLHRTLASELPAVEAFVVPPDLRRAAEGILDGEDAKDIIDARMIM